MIVVFLLFMILVFLALSGAMLSTAPRERRPCHVIAACIFSMLGTVPMTLILLLAYARDMDYRWLLEGPFPFSQLGSGPFLMSVSLPLLFATSFCWAYVLVLLRGDWSAYPR